MNHRRFFPRMLSLVGLVLGVLILTMAMLTFVQAKGAAASIAVTKTAAPTVVHAGDTVNYAITVDNDGDSDLSDVTVDDGLTGCTLTGPSGDDGNLVLEPDETWTYSCSVTAGGGDIVNTATVSATDELSQTVTASAQATVDVIQPSIDVDKQASPMEVRVGDAVSYTITVDNDGDSDLSDVTVDDGLTGCTLAGPSGDDGNQVLELDETWTYTCSITAGSQDIVNTATVTATDELSETVTASDQVTVDVIHPGIEIAKTPDVQTVASGSAVDFTITITNTGDRQLTDVTISDARARDCDNTFATLPAWQRRSYGCTVADVRGGFINSAVVTGTPPAGADVTDADAARVRLDDTETCPNDMVAYWKLDEASGYTDFYYGREGVCVGNCPVAATGHFNDANGARAFDGSTTGVDVPVVAGDDSFNWGVQDSFSVEFWLQTHSASTCPGNEVVVGRDDGSTQLHWWTGCRDGGTAFFRLADTGGSSAGVGGTTDVTDGAWHHVVAVRDAGANEVRIYVDGTEEGVEPATYSTGFDSPTAALSMGRLNLYPYYHFDGVLDEVAIYDRALSPDEARQHYNDGRAGRWYCQGGTFAPVIVSNPVTEAVSGRTYVYDVEAAGNPVPTYTLSISPTGMTIDPTTGLISWTPTVAQEGSHDVEAVASNSLGTDAQGFTIAVGEGTLCPADMIAYWKLDEASGSGRYADFYNGHDGECAEGLDCPTATAGHVNGGQSFGGSTGIDVPADEAFDWGVDDSFSIEFWLQTHSASTCPGNEVVVGRDDGSTQLHWWIGCRDGGTAFFRLAGTGGSSAGVGGTTDVTDGAWHHVVAVRDAGANEVRIYVDGTEEGVEPATYSTGFDSPTAALNMGWLNLYPYYYFDGVVDEVAAYNRVLATTEIERHYNNREASPGYCINPDIAVNKTVGSQLIHPGDVVVYTYAMTNPGDDPLSNIDIVDDRCSPVSSPVGDDDDDNRLDPAETWTCYCSMNLITDTTNIVTVTGSHSLGGTVSATDTISVRVTGREIYLPLVFKHH